MSATGIASARRDIHGWPGYLVSADGVVFSTKRGPVAALATRVNRDGYLVVQVTSAGRSKVLRVHRLVADAFLPARPSPDHEIRHLDGNALNNHADNLAWGTRKENADDRERHGRTARGERNRGGGKLLEEQVREIKERLAKGETLLRLARDFGVSHGLISHIKHGRLWRFVEVSA